MTTEGFIHEVVDRVCTVNKAKIGEVFVRRNWDSSRETYIIQINCDSEQQADIAYVLVSRAIRMFFKHTQFDIVVNIPYKPNPYAIEAAGPNP